MLVWLHGPEDDERQLQRVMPLVSMRNYVAAAPRGVSPAQNGLAGFCWEPTEEAITAATHGVFECIEAARLRFNVSPQCVFLGGYQCGGSMALRIALSALRKVCGRVLGRRTVPLGANTAAAARPGPPTSAVSRPGAESGALPDRPLCEEIRLFHAAGMSVSLRQYPCGDELTTQMLHDLNVWIMERVTGVEASTSEDQMVWSEFN